MIDQRLLLKDRIKIQISTLVEDSCKVRGAYSCKIVVPRRLEEATIYLTM